MTTPATLPNGELLLSLLGLTQQRLQSGLKAAVPLPILLETLKAAASTLPFDEDFYLATYDDVREAHERGEILDPKAHFAEQGYFEGRFGAMPEVDEAFYAYTYPDVAEAIVNRTVGSALEHYMRAGAVEGRFANARDMQFITRWLKLAGRM